MIPKNPSLSKAVTAALPHITAESRARAAYIDRVEAAGLPYDPRVINEHTDWTTGRFRPSWVQPVWETNEQYLERTAPRSREER